MGVRDWINSLLGGGAVGRCAPDEESGTDGTALDDELAIADVRGDIEAEKAAAFDRLSDADNSRDPGNGYG